jgi:hypothetical protein
MRIRTLLLATAGLSLAALAAAQEAEPPRGLSDLEATVNQLLEEESEPAGTDAPQAAPESQDEPRETPPPQPDEPEAAPEVAPASPEAETPAATPADATPAPPPPPLTRAEIAEVERTVRRGRLLVDIAQAGLLATRDMLARISDPDGAGIDGWIAEPQGNAFGVTFYTGGDGDPAALYRATVNGGRVVSREIFLGDDKPALNPVQARMAAARAATEGLDQAACTSQPFNVMVVPPESAAAPIDVYRTSVPDRPGAFPLGGHFRTTVAADGSVGETRAFTNSCVQVELPAAAQGGPVRPVGVTHLLDPHPTEIHVFLSRLIGRPLLVATGEPQRVWLVTGERIAEVRP